MTGKLFVLALLGALVLVNVHGDDDFKEVDNMDEVENMEQEIEDDEESEDRQPRSPFRFRGGFRRTGTGVRSTRTGTRTGGGIFRRTRTSTGGGGSRIFRRTRTSGGGRSGSRIFRRNRSGTRSGTSGGSSGTNGGGTGTLSKIGTVLGIAQLGVDLATTTLNTMSSVERKMVLALGNLEGVDWQGGTVYMNQGSSIKAIPLEVATEEGIQMGGVKTTGPSATGVSGAVCYRFQLIGKSFCLMFKVPYSGANYWNVKVYDGAKQASADIYNGLQNGAFKAGTPVARKDIGAGEGYKIYMKDCSMTNAGQTVLQVYLGLEET
ncbi:actinoporin [Paramuricea clavata]|uniref:Actinoporin, partial n=1 Tax=Paramuricea clavata TaxID=317549 RepID=A0A6S7HT13_PARCT|nr:actinoporin [Paramuricea clavata]